MGGQEIRGEQIRDQSIKRTDIELNFNDNGSLRAEDIPYSALSSIKAKIDSIDVSGVATDLNGLSDVIISSPVLNQVLKYNGSEWINSSATGGASDLDGLSDVVLSSRVSGQVLKYNGSNWVNSSLGTMAAQNTTSVSITGGTIVAQVTNYASLTVGQNVISYQALYIKSDGKLWKSDANAEATGRALFISLEAKTANNACKVASPFPIITNAAWTWTTAGGPIYGSATTSGALTQTAPSGSGDVVVITGFAITSTSLVWCPGYSYIELV